MAVTITTDSGCRVYTVTGNDSFIDQFPGEKAVEIAGTFTEVKEGLPGGTVAAKTVAAPEAYLSRMGVSEFDVTGTTTTVRIQPLQTQTTSHSTNVNK